MTTYTKTTWVNATTGLSAERLNNIETGVENAHTEISGMVPVGTVIWWADDNSTPPTNYLKCDGSSLLTANYSALYAIIGTHFGSADGSHFNLPDLRGVFIRGWDNGRGFDSGRTFGSGGVASGYQADAVKAHKHSFDVQEGGWGYTSTTALRFGGSRETSDGSATSVPTSTVETRPKNVALQALIKYQ